MESQFDALAEAYESSINTLPFRKYIEIPSLLKAVGALRGLCLLDIGCGSGLYTREFARQGAAQVVGTDVAEGMIDFARRRDQDESLGIHYLLRDSMSVVESIDFELDEQFDLVTAIYVLPYAPTEKHLETLCINARKALSPTGKQRFIAFVLNPEYATEAGWYRDYGFDLSQSVAKNSDVKDGRPIHLCAKFDGFTFDVDAFHWSRAAYEKALRQAGFNEINWIRPELSAAGHHIKEESFWKPYIEYPHAVIIDARVSSVPVSA